MGEPRMRSQSAPAVLEAAVLHVTHKLGKTTDLARVADATERMVAVLDMSGASQLEQALARQNAEVAKRRYQCAWNEVLDACKAANDIQRRLGVRLIANERGSA